MSYTTFSFSQWIIDNFDETQYPVRRVQPSMYTASALANREDSSVHQGSNDWFQLASIDAICGGAPLRTQMAYAVSQFVVCSAVGSDVDGYFAAGFWDQLRLNVSTTITKVLQDVSLNKAMAIYLTHFNNLKANPVTGSTPDENYAREIMQLFSIGLVELNEDGTVKLLAGNPIETYSPEDVTEMARVFTGFVNPDMQQALYDVKDPSTRFVGQTQQDADPDVFGSPRIDTTQDMYCYPDEHDWGEKRFLNIVVPAVTEPAQQTTQAARDEVRFVVAELCKHPNVLPFWARRLIQFMRRENPSPAYVQYVVDAGKAGFFELPDGRIIGSGAEGDLQAMVSAVLCHAEGFALDFTDPNAGRVHNPWLAMIHLHRWHSGMETRFPPSLDPPTLRDFFEDRLELFSTSLSDMAGLRAPMHQPSVFGHGEPGYVPIATPAGDAGLVAPGLQAFNWGDFREIHSRDIAGAPSLLLDEASAGAEPCQGWLDIASEIIADSNAFVDKLNTQAFGGRIQTATLDLVKLEFADRAATLPTDSQRRLTATAPVIPMGVLGAYVIILFSVEGQVLR